ncbi:plasmid replication initiator TrfA [Cupriavidus sp. TMH.W2]|uniref:plasmid replication initiator TrfA n=1 Tax=Cupriavidus sp. TMH.W2 TaxID=3434465 RepID=UPI003D782AD7
MNDIDALLAPEEQRTTFEVNGQVTTVHARDVEKSIRAMMDDRNVNLPEAWQLVKAEMARVLNGGKPAKGNAAQCNLFGTDAGPVVQGNVTLAETTEPMPNGGAPAEPAEPQPLRGEALRSLLLQQNDANIHPHAKLLASVEPEDAAKDLLQPERVAARQQALQLGFRFPPTPMGRLAFPADICRTSLFHVASNNVPRRRCEREFMGQLGANISVLYSGMELRHDDERVLMQLIQIAQHQAPWAYIEISTIPFAKTASASSRKFGSNDIEQVERSLWRFREGLIMLAKGRNVIPFNAIRDMTVSGAKRYIQLDPRMVLLFDNSYVLLEDKLYHATNGIERQLFKYLQTNPYAEVYPLKILNLFELCYGTVEALQAAFRKANPEKTDQQARRAILTKKVSDFRQKGLPTALAGLKAKGVIDSFTFDEVNDKVSITKAASFSPVEPRENPVA